MGTDSKLPTQKTGSRTPTVSGISDLVLDDNNINIESKRGSRGPDDYTPITSSDSLSVKLGKIHVLVCQIPEIKDLANNADRGLLELSVRYENISNRLTVLENKLEHRLERGHDCFQIDKIDRCLNDDRTFTLAIQSLEKLDENIKSRVSSIETFVEERKVSSRKYTFLIISTFLTIFITVFVYLWNLVDEKTSNSARDITELNLSVKSLESSIRKGPDDHLCSKLDASEKRKLLELLPIDKIPAGCKQ